MDFSSNHKSTLLYPCSKTIEGLDLDKQISKDQIDS
jgi:hypothetical protein